MSEAQPNGRPVLVVAARDDHAHLVCQILQLGDFPARYVLGGAAGLAAAHAGDADLALVDGPLPDLSAAEFARRLRLDSAASQLPLIVTAPGGDGAAYALEAGADDYLAKPWRAAELHSRVRAKLRQVARGGRLTAGALTLDLPSRSAVHRGRAVDLTPVEFEVLRALASRAPDVVSRAELLAALGRADAVASEHAVNFHVMRLRRKLGDPSPIRTVRGTGYALAPED